MLLVRGSSSFSSSSRSVEQNKVYKLGVKNWGGAKLTQRLTRRRKLCSRLFARSPLCGPHAFMLGENNASKYNAASRCRTQNWQRPATAATAASCRPAGVPSLRNQMYPNSFESTAMHIESGQGMKGSQQPPVCAHRLTPLWPCTSHAVCPPCSLPAVLPTCPLTHHPPASTEMAMMMLRK